MAIQVTATVGPALGAPKWLLTVVVVACMIGSAPVLLATWLYDVTPEGLRRTPSSEGLGEDEAGSGAAAQARFRRKMTRWTVATAACAALLFAVTLFARQQIVAVQPRSLAVLRGSGAQESRMSTAHGSADVFVLTTSRGFMGWLAGARASPTGREYRRLDLTAVCGAHATLASCDSSDSGRSGPVGPSPT